MMSNITFHSKRLYPFEGDIYTIDQDPQGATVEFTGEQRRRMDADNINAAALARRILNTFENRENRP